MADPNDPVQQHIEELRRLYERAYQRSSGPTSAPAATQSPDALIALIAPAATALAASPALAMAAARAAARAGGPGGAPAPPPGSPLYDKIMSAAAGVAASGGAVTGLARAADPFSTFPTFQASLKGVAIEAGSAVLPAFGQMSQMLQDLERYLERVDPAVKQAVGSFVVWSTVGAGATLAAVRFGQAVAAATVAVGRLGLVLLSTPWGAVVAGTALVAALAYQWSQAGDNAERAGRFFGEAGGKAREARPGEEVQRDFSRLPASVRKRLTEAGGDQEKIARALAEEREQAQKSLEAARAEQVRGLAGGPAAAKRLGELAGREMPAILEEFERRLPDINAGRFPDSEHNRRVRRAAMLSSDPATRRLVGEMRAGGIDVDLSDAQEYMNRRVVRESLGERRYTEIYGSAHLRDRPAWLAFLDPLMRPGRPTPQPTPEVAMGAVRGEAAAARLKAAEERVRIAEGVASKAGSDRLVRDFQGPTPAIFTDPTQLADRIQLAALAVGDKSAANLAKQLEQALKSGEMLQMIHGELSRLNQNVQPRLSLRSGGG